MSETIQVLLVEDSRTWARMVRDHLQSHVIDGMGFCVSMAASVAEALEQIECTKPDIVILDLYLLDSLGVATIQKIRPATDKPIIVLSGSMVKERWMVDIVKEGADNVIEKGTLSLPQLAWQTWLWAMRHRNKNNG